MSHAKTNPIYDTVPQQRQGDQLELSANQAVTLYPEYIPSGIPELAAVIQTANMSNADYFKESGESVDCLMVVDMRSVPLSNVPGYKTFADQYVTETAEYMLIDYANLDFKNNQGFKALRAGESFDYGRPTDRTPSSDKKSRFQGASSSTSRNHFNISIGTNGEVTVMDLGSSNETTILTGKNAQEALQDNDRQLKLLAAAPAIGQTALKIELDNFEVETGTSRAIILEEAELTHLKDAAYDPNQPQLTRELLLQYPQLEAKGGLRIGNHDFMFSGVVTGRGERKHAVAYVKDDAGKVSPRLFYKSMSDGGWRVTAGVYEDGVYSKGEDSNDGGYVQLTKPVEEIVQYLEMTEKNGSATIDMDNVRSLFMLKSLEQQGLNNFDSEVKATRLDGRKSRALYEAYQPGVGYTKDGIQARRELAKVELPKGFEPAFDTVERQYRTTHSLAGKTNYKVFAAKLNGRAIEWHMAESEQGDVWIDKIAYKDADINSYGTASEVILAGALSTKPYEYKSQLNNMNEGLDYLQVNSQAYVRMAPFWNNLAPIQRYKQNRRQ